MGEPAIDRLKAIAHPLRHTILAALGRGELNVGEIETATRIGQPTLSQQLSVLRKAGLVDTRRESKLVFYSIDAAALAAAIQSLEELAPGSGNAAPKPGRGNGLSGAAVFAHLD